MKNIAGKRCYMHLQADLQDWLKPYLTMLGAEIIEDAEEISTLTDYIIESRPCIVKEERRAQTRAVSRSAEIYDIPYIRAEELIADILRECVVAKTFRFPMICNTGAAMDQISTATILMPPDTGYVTDQNLLEGAVKTLELIAVPRYKSTVELGVLPMEITVQNMEQVCRMIETAGMHNLYLIREDLLIQAVLPKEPKESKADKTSDF